MSQAPIIPQECLLTGIALEKAAKYICTAKCGLCPMVVEGFSCPGECSVETLPWQCWQSYFKEKLARAEVENREEGKAAA